MSPALSNSNQSIQFSHDASQSVTSDNLASQHLSNLDNKQSLLSKSIPQTIHHKSSSGLLDGNQSNGIPLHNQTHFSNHVDISNPSTSSTLPPPHGATSPDTLGKSFIQTRNKFFCLTC